MFRSTNPATGEQIATHAELTAEQIEQKVALAATAFDRWRVTPIADRVALLRRIADAYDANRDRLARMATDEMGKTLKSALAEVDKCAAAFRHYADHGPAMLEPQSTPLRGGGTAEVTWLPQGPVLAIMPWNFPYWQAVRFLARHFLHQRRDTLHDAGVLQQRDIAGKDGGGEEADRLPIGEVPRHDRQHRALREPGDLRRAAAGQFGALGLQHRRAVIGIMAEGGGAFVDLRQRRFQRLAHLVGRHAG